MTEFNANAKPTVAVEDAYRLYVDVKDTGSTPVLELQGRGVTAYSQSSNSDVSQDLDVLGYTDTTAGAPKVTQEISPLRVRKGSKLAGMIFDAYLSNKSSITVDIYEKYPIAADFHYDDGKVVVDTWNEQYLIPPLLKLIQEQKKEIDTLKQQLATLTERMDRYEQGLQ